MTRGSLIRLCDRVTEVPASKCRGELYNNSPANACMVNREAKTTLEKTFKLPFHFFFSFPACSDFMSAVFGIPFKISGKFNNNCFFHGIGACSLWMYTDAVGNVASILNLFLIAIDRYVS